MTTLRHQAAPGATVSARPYSGNKYAPGQGRSVTAVADGQGWASLTLPTAPRRAFWVLTAPNQADRVVSIPASTAGTVTSTDVQLGTLDPTRDLVDTRPQVDPTPDDDAEREAFIPARLSAAALGASYGRGVSIASAGASTASADNGTVIQGLIDDLHGAGGGTVFVPRGLWHTAPLRLRTGVRLAGEGEYAARLRLVAGANQHMIRLADGNTELTAIETLYLDGNKAQQTAGNVVHLDNTGYTNSRALPSLGDPNHHLRRVVIVNAKAAGVHLAGTWQQSFLDSLLIKDCDTHSVHLAAPDTHLTSCVSARSGLDGFRVAGNSNRLMNCKAFLAGRLDHTQGSGFRIAVVNGADLTHCEAQDNRQHGFSLTTTQASALLACRADRNGIGPEPANGWGGDGIYAENVTDSRIDLISLDRNDGNKRMQRWAYNCGGGNARNLVNIVAGTHADDSQAGVGSFGATSAGLVRWKGASVASAFA